MKSGVQLLLLEQGLVPEMFRLEFPSKKLAKELVKKERELEQLAEGKITLWACVLN